MDEWLQYPPFYRTEQFCTAVRFIMSGSELMSQRRLCTYLRFCTSLRMNTVRLWSPHLTSHGLLRGDKYRQ